VTLGTWIGVVIVFFISAQILLWSGGKHEEHFRDIGMEPLPGVQKTAGIVWLLGFGIALVFFLWVAKGGG
jgi:hypothetical protein